VTESITVLLIEDNPGDVRLVREALRESKNLLVKLIVADNLSRGLKYIAAEGVDVILLDLNLPDSQGLQTFRQVNKFALNRPVIIMSILSDKELIYQALKEGAQAYLIKGEIQNEALIRAMRYAIWSYHSA
jgi:two-component system cell cycle response regulator